MRVRLVSSSSGGPADLDLVVALEHHVLDRIGSEERRRLAARLIEAAGPGAVTGVRWSAFRSGELSVFARE